MGIAGTMRDAAGSAINFLVEGDRPAKAPDRSSGSAHGTFSNLPPEALDRLGRLDAMADAAAGRLEGGFGARQQLIDAVQNAKAARGSYDQRLRDLYAGAAGDPKEIARLDDGIKKAQRALDEFDRTNGPARARDIAIRDLRDEVVRYARAVREPVPFVKTAAPKGTVEKLAAEIASLRDERLRVEGAPVTLETARRQLDALIDDLATQGRPHLVVGVDDVGHTRRRMRQTIRVEWPESLLGAQPMQPDTLLMITNAAALIAWACKDTIKEALHADLEASYAAIDLALDPDDRRARLADIDKRLLDLQRLQAELTWAALADGQDVWFPNEIEPRAVLGV